MEDEDKAFDLLAKMYNELTIFKSDMNEFRHETNKKLDAVDGHIIRIENEHDKKLDALFDGNRHMKSFRSMISGLIILKQSWTTCLLKLAAMISSLNY